MNAFFVVSWYGNPQPAIGTPGILRGTHDEQTARKQAQWWNDELTKKSGGLAVYAGAFPADEAHALFDLVA